MQSAQSKQIRLDLGPRSYTIYMGSGIAADFPRYYKDRFKNRGCAVVTNTAIASIYSSYIDTLKKELGCAVHVLPDGEKHKTVSVWAGIFDTLIESRLDRKSVIIALGGGVVGDMAGFAAACFMRGVDYVQIPTTLLSMVDSSVGGKTAVDHPLGKNLIGAFHQPSAVWIDTDFLKTLPRREFVAGCAEAFKCAFIGGADMWEFIMNKRGAVFAGDPAPLFECVERSIRVKAGIVSLDEKEAGARALLNFGHTFAHALEQYYGFEGLLHGEAVLWGIVCAVELAKTEGLLPQEYWADFDRILDGLPLPPLPSAPQADKITAAMKADKKAEFGNLRFILPISPGVSEIRGGIGEKKIIKVIEKMLHL